MALIIVSPGNFNLDFDSLDFALFSGVSLTSGTGFRFDFSDGSYWSMTGTGLAYGGPNGLPTAGTITGFTAREPTDELAATFSGLDLSAAAFSAFVQALDETGFVAAVVSGADSIVGGDVADDIRGGAGADMILGGAGNDTLEGEAGGDLLVGDAPGGTVLGGDSLLGGDGADVLAAGSGNDRLQGDDGSDWLEGEGEDDTFYGGLGDDVAVGGSASDTADGGDGNDFADGGDGVDTLVGAAGEDWLDGGGSGDLGFGGVGNDIGFGGAGDDAVDGGSGNDIVGGGAGNDALVGDSGDDVLQGDDIFSAAGNDTLYGGDGNDVAFGGDGSDGLYGGAGADLLSADAGDDTLVGGAGNDLLLGDEGNDIAIYRGFVTVLGTSDDMTTVDAGADGIDTLVSVETILHNQPLRIDLTGLGPAQGFVIQGGATGDVAGWSVSNAGDVNGDGYDDLIVGARNGDDGGVDAGEAYVVLGSGAGFGTAVTTSGVVRQVIDLTSLSAAQGFVIQGDASGDWAGFAVAAAGDVNGDGYDDLIVGSALGDDGGGNAGEAYVLLGSSAGFGNAMTNAGVVRQVIDLTSLSVAQGFVIQGDATDDQAGFAVSAAGDFNGDGYDDLVVGAYGGDDGGSGAGEAYVVLGSGGGFGTAVTASGVVRQVIDLTSLGSAQGFVIRGDATGDGTGRSVSWAGDVNGDGYDDLVVGANRGDDGGNSAGEAYVVLGAAAGFGTADGAGRQVIDLTSLGSAQGFVIQGDATNDVLGGSVSTAGDVNGDGYDDLIVGARDGDDGGNYAGEAYVVLGSGTGFGVAVTAGGVVRQVIDLTSLAAAQGFIIQGDTADDRAGVSVSAAGDVNGDGYDDLIVGAFRGDDGGLQAGEAYVVLGGGAGFGAAVTAAGVVRQVIDLTSLGAAQGFVIQGDTANDQTGYSVSAAGDVNGDGYDDLIVGAHYGDDGGSNAGEAYVIFGAAFGSGAPIVNAGTAGADFLIGDRGADTLGGPAGGADVFRGGAGDDTISVPDLAFADIDGGTGIDTLVLTGGGLTLDLRQAAPSELQSVEWLDLTGSGNNTLLLDQLAVLDASEERYGAAGILHVEGNVSDRVQLIGSGWLLAGNTLVGGTLFERFVQGQAELRVEQGLEVTAHVDLTSLAPAQGFVIQGDTTDDRAGYSVSSAGDINGDGYDDLIVGAPRGDDGGVNSGEAYVVFGHSAGFGVVDGNGRRVIDLTSLGAAQGFVVQGDALDDRSGSSVAAAGDVNGDGYDDVIIGAPFGVDGGIAAGEAYIVFGSSAAFGTVDGSGRRVVDLSSIDVRQGFVIQGDTAYDNLGVRVSSAGDVNGDGYDDLIAGAYAGDDGGDRAGEAYVVFGSGVGFGTSDVATGRFVIDLTSLSPVQGFIVQGDNTGDGLGYGISSAGDINGDGYDDLIAGAFSGDDSGSYAGEAYVVFGRATGFGTLDSVGNRQVLDLSSLDSAQGFVIQGDTLGDLAGWSSSTVGDINGDGYDDLIVGAPAGNDGGSFAGEAYVLFGSGSGFGVAVTTSGVVRQVIDLGSLDASQGFIVQGDTADDGSGRSVAAAGDVNGDGYDDLIVGAYHGDDGGISAGEAYVVFGNGSGFGVAVTTSGVVRQVVDLSSLDASQGFIVQGDTASDLAGYSVSSAGDVNGDGYDDLIVGAWRGDDGGLDAGEAYVLFGNPTGLAVTVSLTGTGAADMLIGGRLADTLGGPAGGADIFRGGAGDDRLLVPDLGFADIDGGTGIDTLVLGSGGLVLDLRQAPPPELQSVEWFDLTGSGNNTLVLDRLAVFDLSEERYGGSAILRIEGNAGDRVELGDLGWSREGSIVEGAVTFDRWIFDNAELRIEQGVAVNVLVDLTSLGPAQGFVIRGDTAGDRLGVAIASAGDINGDGYDDLIVGAHQGDDAGAGNGGEAYVVFGSSTAFGVAVAASGVVRQVLDVTSLVAAQGFIIQGDTPIDYTGISVASAGDVNGDGYDDLIVGARGGDDGGSNAGEAYVVFGTGIGFGVAVTTEGVVRQVVDLSSLTSSLGFIIQGDTELDEAGRSVAAAGDINGDGYDDLIVGAHQGDDGGSSAGEAYVVFGSGAGFGIAVTTDGVVRQVIDVSSLVSSQGFVIQGDTAGDGSGRSVAMAGDVNGDGYDDLIVGALLGDDGGVDAGEAYVVFGGVSGFGIAVTTAGVVRQVIDLTSLVSSQGFIIQGDASSDSAGGAVATAGDVNGDGYDDLIVGAYLGDDGAFNGGEAYVVFGRSSGFGVAVTTDAVVRQVVDLTSLGSSQGFIIQGDSQIDRAGISVSTAGDINGDGYDDLLVGSLFTGAVGAETGATYVVFGSGSGFGLAVTTAGVVRQVIDLASLDAAQGLAILGDTAGDRAGRSVAAAGDVNGDGFDDLILGAYRGDDGGADAGEAYVLFGAAFGSGAPVVNAGTAGAEFLIGDRGADTLGGPSGGTDIFRGGAGDDTISVPDLAFADIDGGTGFDRLVLTGSSLALDLRVVSPSELQSIEHIDLTGSGNNTLMLDGLAVFDVSEERYGGAAILHVEGNAGDRVQLTDLGWLQQGSTTVGGVAFDRWLLGNAELRIETSVTVEARIDLTSLSRSQGFVIQGDSTADFTGESVSSIGDVNGDGFDDLIIGAYGSGIGGYQAGASYVIFGSADISGSAVVVAGVARQVLDLSSLGAAQGFVIRGDTANDNSGFSVSSAGDVNGDGFADMIVGALYGDDDGGPAAGEAYVVFGAASGFGVATTTGGVVRQVIDLTTLSSAEGFIIQGDSGGDRAGNSVSAAGDVNGDGFDDMIVGARFADDGGNYAGEAYVVFGAGGGFGSAVTFDGAVRQVVDLTSLSAAQGFIIRGDTSQDQAGFDVSGAGDVNGDGLDDLIVGARYGDDAGSNAGEAYILFGSSGGFGVQVLNAETGQFRQVVDLTSLVSAQGFVIQGDTNNDQAGFSVSSAGDVNGDGFDDLIVGAKFGDDGGGNAGEAYVIFGTASGFGVAVTTDGVVRQVLDLTSLGSSQGFIVQGDATLDEAGFSVTSAGDINGDGLDDLIVGAVGGDDGGLLAGEAYVVFGSIGTFGVAVTLGGVVRRVVDLTSLTPEQGFVVQGDTAGDQAGRSVSAAGDVNNDGFDDLVIGAPRGSDGGTFAGEAYVIFGAAFGSGAPIVNAGTAGANFLIGDHGADTLGGSAGGADIFRGGAGDDTISVPDFAFADIDGGTGFDRLVLTGSGLTLDLQIEAPSKLQSIEHIDLTGSGNNTLTSDPQAFFQVTEERGIGIAAVAVEGDAGDELHMSVDGGGWNNLGTIVAGGTTYDRWVWDPDAGGAIPATLNAELWVDTDVDAFFT